MNVDKYQTTLSNWFKRNQLYNNAIQFFTKWCLEQNFYFMVETLDKVHLIRKLNIHVPNNFPIDSEVLKTFRSMRGDLINMCSDCELPCRQFSHFDLRNHVCMTSCYIIFRFVYNIYNYLYDLNSHNNNNSLQASNCHNNVYSVICSWSLLTA